MPCKTTQINATKSKAKQDKPMYSNAKQCKATQCKASASPSRQASNVTAATSCDGDDRAATATA
eukprot:3381622-Pyramimonas_sp.AAC.1